MQSGDLLDGTDGPSSGVRLPKEKDEQNLLMDGLLFLCQVNRSRRLLTHSCKQQMAIRLIMYCATLNEVPDF